MRNTEDYTGEKNKEIHKHSGLFEAILVQRDRVQLLTVIVNKRAWHGVVLASRRSVWARSRKAQGGVWLDEQQASAAVD